MMHREIEKVWAVHEMDARLLELNTTLQKLDNWAAAQAALTNAEKELARLHEELTAARVALNDAEVSLKANETRSEGLQKRLYGGMVSKQAEVEAVEHEIADLKAKAGVLETTILESMDAIEAAESAVKAQEEVVQKWKERVKTIRAAYATSSGELQAKIQEASEKRAECLALAPETVMFTYEAIRKRTKTTAMARLMDGTCEGCHMQVPSFTIMRLKNSTELTTCDNCGRLLFLEV